MLFVFRFPTPGFEPGSEHLLWNSAGLHRWSFRILATHLLAYTVQ